MLTKQQFKDLDEKDFQNYFHLTHIKVMEEGSYNFKYMRIEKRSFNDDGGVSLYLRGNEGTKIYRLNHLQIDFSLPKTGIYQGNKNAVFVSRLFEKQYKKAVCNETFSFIPLDYLVYQNVSYNLRVDMELRAGQNNRLLRFQDPKTYWSVKEMNALFFPDDDKQQLTIEDKIKAVQNRKVFSSCLNCNFAVSLGILGKLPTLWFRNTPVGEISDHEVKLMRPSFKQEAIDFFIPYNIGVTVYG